LHGISKRGEIYLRTLLIHGARSVLRIAARHTDPTTTWLKRVQARRNTNIAAVALANKHARVVWALLARAGTIPQTLWVRARKSGEQA
jgi:transposase